MKRFLIVFALFAFASCEKDDPEIENEEELITTLKYTLTSTADGTVVEGVFQDIDGDGGNAPLITNINLKSNTIYNGTLTLLNESVSPAENISEEVEEEADEHQFFFAASQANLTVTYNDTDGNNRPVGLKTILTTGTSSSGKLRVTLRHLPNKSATGVVGGDITNAGGETDIEVEFNVQIQ